MHAIFKYLLSIEEEERKKSDDASKCDAHRGAAVGCCRGSRTLELRRAQSVRGEAKPVRPLLDETPHPHAKHIREEVTQASLHRARGGDSAGELKVCEQPLWRTIAPPKCASR